MRIHTDRPGAVATAMFRAAQTRDCSLEYSSHGSRGRTGAVEFSLAGRGERHTLRKNTGYQGSSVEYAAHWDDWGVVIAAAFVADPDATIPSAYETAAMFHMMTGGRFDGTGFTECPGPRHKWDWMGDGTFTCKKCGATKSRP